MKDTTDQLKTDQVMKGLLDKFGLLTPSTERSDLLESLIRAVISQQLSGKAATSIYKKFKLLLPGEKIDPLEILKLDDDTLRSVGLSRPKVKYIKGICEAVISKKIDLENLVNLSDDEVIEELVKLNGIGRWSAEMLLIFTLRRPDIFSVGDLGLRNAVAKLYQIDRENLPEIEELSLRWKPYRSYASLLLWRSLEPEKS